MKILEHLKRMVEQSNEEYGFSFITSYAEMMLQCQSDIFNELIPPYRFVINKYGYAESIEEIVEYLISNFGDCISDEFVVTISAFEENENMYKYGCFVKNGVIANRYQRWFEEHGGEPQCQFGKTEEGKNIFACFTLYRKEKQNG